VLLLLSLVQDAFGHELNVDDPRETLYCRDTQVANSAIIESIRDVSQKVAYKMMQFYPGNQTGQIPGLFGDPYYWWEAGAAFGVRPSSIITSH
jgi:mannan endo-1,6-alpha-mannosidase